MLFQKSLIGNSRSAQKQWADVVGAREAYRANEASHAAMMKAAGFSVNQGLIPQDVYQEFDSVTTTRFRSDDGDTFLNDLLGQSSSVNIGKLVVKHRRASDAGSAQTSMSGQTGVKADQVEYNYDGTLIPMHDAGFGRNFREWNAQNSEGFDALIDDQRETVASIRAHIADSFLDGHKDKDGNIIVVDSVSWSGMRADARVAQVDLGAGGVNFDFTDANQTYTAVEAAFKEVRDVLWITNNCQKEATYYVSREVMSAMERESSENAGMGKFINRLSGLMGVAAIKVSSKLVGNEIMAFPLDSDLVRPLVGMGINTVAMPRPLYNSNYDFTTWGAIGFQVRTDFANRKCAMFAQA